MEEEIENLDSPNQEESTPENAPEIGLPADPIEVEPKDREADPEALKQELQALYEQNRKLKGFKRDKDGKWVKKDTLQVAPKEQKVSEDVTRTELYSLMKANVPEEDTNEVVIFAKSHGMNVTEALKDNRLKAILKVNDEYRKSAEVANTKNARYGTNKVSDEQVLADMAEGKLPDVATLADLREKKRLEKTK
jgi:hypothetical protein